MNKKYGYWTKEKCCEEALKYKTRKEFQIEISSAYQASYRNEWLDEICSHMVEIKKLKGYWTKERCHKEALKYKLKKDFISSGSVYYIAYRNGWINEICSHMEIVGNRFKRCIYAVEFSDNHVYVGLTYNTEKRFKNHQDKKKNTTVYKYIHSSGLIPIFKKLTDYIPVQEASLLEEKIKNDYKKLNWLILNKVKCGATAGYNLKWTKKRCSEEALKYKTRVEFHYNSSSAWNSALFHGWLDEICSFMFNNGRLQNKNGIWQIKDNCLNEALKYKTRMEFVTNSRGAYKAAHANKWLDEICIHMPKRNTPKHYKKYFEQDI